MPKKKKESSGGKRPLAKYPKLIILLLVYMLTFIIFSSRDYLLFYSTSTSIDGLGAYFLGILYAYGFTAPSATAVFLAFSKNSDLLWTGFVAGLGSVTADLLTFKLLRISFRDEIEELAGENIFRHLDHHVPKMAKKLFIPALGAFIIASPLPDEIGIFLLATSGIKERPFAVASYLLNTSGILLILTLGKTVF